MPDRNETAGPLTLVTALVLLCSVFTIAGPFYYGEDRSRSPEEVGSYSDAMASLHFLHAQRAYPNDDIPSRQYMDEYERIEPQVRAARERSGKVTVGGYTEPADWQALGPKNLGGRTIALAINPLDPDVMYAGSASGGVWRTDSGGRGVYAWHRLDTGFPVLGVNAIAVDPSDTSTVYIGTGEVYGRDSSIGGLYERITRGSYGIGLLKSSDGGATWSKSLDWSYDQRRGVLAIDIDPTNPLTVFAGTSEGIYRSPDGGGTWTRVLDVPMVVDIVINPSNSDTIFASCGNLGIPSDAGIFRSVDGGDNWVELDGGLPADWSGKTLLDIYEAAPNVVYADVADMFNGVGLYRSLDSGETWEHLSRNYPDYNLIADYQGWFSHYIVVNPVDSSQVMAAGIQLYRSIDGGRTFQRTSTGGRYGGIVPIGGPEGSSEYIHVDHHAFARHPTDPNTVILGNDGGVWETSDFGDTFASRNGYYQTAQFYGGFTSSPLDSNLALGGLQDNGTIIYRGGLAWDKTLGGDGGMTGMRPSLPNVLMASTQYCRIYKSTNDGDTWFRMNSEMEVGSDVVFIAPFAQAPSDRSISYAGRTRVWRSNDFIQNWFVAGGAPPLDGNPVLSIAINLYDPEVVWAATVPAAVRSGVFHTTNGGGRWNNVTRDLPDRYPVDIVSGEYGSKTAYVVFSGFGTSHLFKTDDGGITWIDIDRGNLPDIPTSAFAIDPFNREYLYLGNDFGVWFSPDDGQTWEPFTNGLPPAAIVMDLSISRANGTIRAAAHGLGAWERRLVSVASAVGDTIPPSFDISILQNPVVKDHIDLYAIPSEPLPTRPGIAVDGVDVPVSTINASEGNIYVGDYLLSGSGDYTITISGRDLAGNDTLQTREFTALQVKASVGGSLSAAGGLLRTFLPPRTFTEDEYVIAYLIEEDFQPGSAVLYAVELLAGQMSLNRYATLTLGFEPHHLAGADPTGLRIYHQDGTDWVPLDSYVDMQNRIVEVSIAQLGKYSLRLDETAGSGGSAGNELQQNYPNPFNSSTSIRYSVSRSAHVELYIVNVRGQRVRTLVSTTISPGSHVVSWDGRSDSGLRSASGVYLVVLNIDGKVYTRKALLLQ